MPRLQRYFTLVIAQHLERERYPRIGRALAPQDRLVFDREVPSLREGYAQFIGWFVTALLVTPVSNDGVTKLSPFTHETRRLSDDHEDGVQAVRRRADAIDANLKFRNVQKQTLSH